ncbi:MULTISPECIES: TetR/AcrR family transcriptional regulator [unclassified Mesorhizobium]|uniref:TetR/AcrR family transcriptional regulator n=1 Tax=unclassified Mesorhizobium TaxID=325217 RepID=UPI00112B8E61|nr:MULTISPECIES: TetR/AcrR family transcriptional regulator [unclassified Mesorhizobium]TPK92742.1 TetR family transcriptional regulator [Mesorhizobium sp. B2-4-16]TPL73085.1 TetR family transcriptional regulator [Mesorhizobium sp. B2-4-3]
MARQSLRENLIEAGFRTIWNAGYTAAGVRDIVAAAGARPGSFTNHFASKEDFAGEVLERYFAYVGGLVEDALAQDGTPPIGRLRRYLDVITSKLEAHDWARGCMIGNLSLETAVHSEPLRLRLVDIFERWRRPFAACIAEGQATGEITKTFDADDLADFLLSSWQGAMLRMKVERSPEPLERFKKIIFSTVFGKETA